MMKQQADAAFAQGDWESGLRIWRNITSGDCAATLLLEHALLLRAYYCLNEAMEIFTRLARHPSATSAELLPAARCLFELARFGACAELTARALTLNPQDPDIAALHAAALERAGDKEQARTLLLHLLENHPRHTRAIRQLAHIERRDGSLDAAAARLRQALTAASTDDDWQLRYELAAVLDLSTDYDGAMHALHAAKQQLTPRIQQHRPAWRAIANRQWEVTQALTSSRLHAWQAIHHEQEQTLRLCLMAGFPRSGTTLLEQIVTAHDDCLGTDESGILASQFRDPMILAAGSTAEAIAELDSLDPESLAAGRQEYLRCTTEHIGESIRSRILIEKDPLLTADLALPLRLFPEAKILMPLRDPRDVVISFFFTIVPLAPNSVAAGSIEDSCRYYAEVMRHWLMLRERLDPSQWMESRYEDLLDAPEPQTRRLCDFLGLTWNSSMTAHHRQAATRAVSTPTYDDVSKPLYRRAQGRWRNYEAWLAPHLHHLEPYVAAFGYDP